MKFRKFLTFLVVLIVVVSLGMTVYFFVRDDEVISINTRPLNLNVGDEISLENLEFSRTHANTNTNIDFNGGGSDVKEIIEFNNTTQRYVAVSGGSTKIVITTTSKRNPKFEIRVTVGNGSVEYPFQITNETELSLIGSTERPMSASYAMANNIALTKEFTPIGYKSDGSVLPFEGTFFGRDNTLSGLIINGDSNTTPITNRYDYAGMFAHIGSRGKVKDLYIENTVINGSFLGVGAVAGKSSGTINRIYVTNATITNNTVTSTASATGGLIGEAYMGDDVNKDAGAKIYSSYSKNGVVSGHNLIGGIAGSIKNVSCWNSWTSTTLKSTSAAKIGGLIGKVSGSVGNVYQSYSLASFNCDVAGAVIGGVIGEYDGTYNDLAPTKGMDVRGVYFNTERINNDKIKGVGTSTMSTTDWESKLRVVGKISSEMMKQSTYKFYQKGGSGDYEPWNFAGTDVIWGMPSGKYPEICSTLEIMPSLGGMDTDPDGDGEGGVAPENIVTIGVNNTGKTNNTYLSDILNGNPDANFILKTDLDLNGGNWIPIPLFTGNLFADKKPASASKLNTFANEKVASEYYGIYNFCVFSETDNAASNGNIGFIRVLQGNIFNIQFGKITTRYTSPSGTQKGNVGAIVGKMNGGASISNVTVNGLKMSADADIMGGIVGLMDKKNNYIKNVTLANAVIKNKATAIGNKTGGIVGSNNGTIGSQYNLGDDFGAITAGVSISAGGYVGGIVGVNKNSVMNCHVKSGYEFPVEGIEPVEGEIKFISANKGFAVGGIVGENDGRQDRVKVYHTTVDTKITVDPDSSLTTEKDPQHFIGGIVGYNRIGDIFDAVVTKGSNISTDKFNSVTGGIAGRSDGDGKLETSSINYCFNYGNIVGEAIYTMEWAGGIVGHNRYSKIINSANMGNVKATIVGGIAAYSEGNVNTDKPTAYKTNYIDIRDGALKSGSGLIENCYVGGSTPLDGEAYKITVDLAAAKPMLAGYVVGGLVGAMESGYMRNCFTQAFISGINITSADTKNEITYDDENRPSLAGMVACFKSFGQYYFGVIENCIAATRFPAAGIIINGGFSRTSYIACGQNAYGDSSKDKRIFGTIRDSIVVLAGSEAINDIALYNRSENSKGSIYGWMFLSRAANEIAAAYSTNNFNDSMWKLASGSYPYLKALTGESINEAQATSLRSYIDLLLADEI